MKESLGKDGDLRTNFELDQRRSSNPFRYESDDKNNNDKFLEEIKIENRHHGSVKAPRL